MKKILLLVLVMLLLVQTVSAINTDYWNFNGNTLNSISGRNFTETGSGLVASYVAPGYNGSLNTAIYTKQRLLTISNAVATGISIKGEEITPFSVSFYMNVANVEVIGSGYYVIDTRTSAGAGQLKPAILYNGITNSTDFIMFTDTGNNTVSSASLTDYDWWFITVTYNGANTMRVYVNGTLNNTGTYTGGNVNSNTGDIEMGLNILGIGDKGGMRIDDLRVFNTALTPSQVYDLFGGLISTNFTIYNLLDDYNLSTIYNYSANIDGTTYNSDIASGELITPFNTTTGTLHNITLYPNNYFNKTYINYNTSSGHITADLTYYKSRHLINATVRPANTSLITNFSITTGSGFSGSTITGSLVAETVWNTSEVVSFISPNYELKNWTTTGTTNDAHQFNVFTRNSFDLNFFDEITRGIISNVTIQLISNIYGNNYSTSNGTKYIDLLTPATYTIRYESAGYDQRSYVITLTNMSYNLLNLYLLNSSYAGIVDVTATVYDNSGNALEGAVISVQKYDGTTNTYRVMNRITTNFEGKAVFSATNSEYYKFLIEYPLGNVVYESSPTYIYSTTMSFIVQISDEVGSLFTKQAGISYDLSYLGGDLFKFIYTDANNYGSNFCLRIYQEDYTGETEINTSCSTSNSATLYGGYVGVNGTTYNAKAYVTIGGKEYLLEKISNANPKVTDFGKTGLFIIAILTIAVMCLSLYNIVIALLLTPIPLFLGAILGIVNISVGLAGAVWIGFMILAVIIGNRT
jgi:hypothetical protein